MSVTDLQAEIAAKEAEIKKLKGEIERLERLDPDKRLAEALHSIQCRDSHDDRCGWGWEVTIDGKSPNWTGYAHKRYLDKAQKVLREMPYLDVESIITLVQLIN